MLSYVVIFFSESLEFVLGGVELCARSLRELRECGTRLPLSGK